MHIFAMVGAAAILLTGYPARAGVTPPPKPTMVVMDSVATECIAWDWKCLSAHDGRVLDLALLSRDRDWCSAATRVGPCLDSYDMIVGDWKPAKR